MRHRSPYLSIPVTALAALLASCHGPSAPAQAIAEGLQEVRDGLSVAGHGMDTYRAGERLAGLRLMQGAQATMAMGIGAIEAGMGSCAMCEACMGEMSAAMEMMASGMAMMEVACDMMADGDPTNDAAATADMDRGMAMMEDGADSMEGSASGAGMGSGMGRMSGMGGDM